MGFVTVLVANFLFYFAFIAFKVSTYIREGQNEKELVSLQDETNLSDPMAKKSPEDRVKELEAENKKLQKALELEKLRSKAYDTMINVAEETFNIPIRNKSGTKQ